VFGQWWWWWRGGVVVFVLIVCQYFVGARRIMSFILYKGRNSYYVVEMQRDGLLLPFEINH